MWRFGRVLVRRRIRFGRTSNCVIASCSFFFRLVGMASVFRRAVDLAKEARMRGFWGTFQALKGKKLGMASCLVGTDKLGNRYYENKNVRYGRERWVEYRELETGEQLDSMNVPPEW